MSDHPWQGLFTALVTPFKQSGALDLGAFEKLITRQIDAGVDGLVPCGTTGETPTLSSQEQDEVIATAVGVAAGRVPVVAGAGSNATDQAVANACRISDLGVDGLLVAPPYYNKPPQRGIFAHYQAIHDATRLPIMVYNIPSRTGVDIGLELMHQLIDKLERVIAIKDASGDIQRANAFTGHPHLSLLSGDDNATLDFMDQGAHGVVSVVSNILPQEMKQVVSLKQSGQHQAAEAAMAPIRPLVDALFSDGSPGPCKKVLADLKLCEPTLRLPMVEPNPECCQLLDQAMQAFGINS